MRVTVRAAGAADAGTVWQRYVRTAAWPSWSPQIRAVEAEDELRAGMRGQVVPVLGPRVDFVVDAVDPEALTWRWRVRVGPVRMSLWHAVRPRTPSGATTELVIDGSAPVVLAYTPLARLALRRLVRP
ncbi:SRPBCC family protein [uncultured Streptomyces sp.]|uniref:SRPBCC family protein n=1 Tax=uncultured Streptomyces sp. TaxID=174707 RepID=UPI002629D2CA|nr:SRPBCC family protein [uncultured Streptomyces sp.]